MTTTTPGPVSIRNLETGKATTITFTTWLDWLSDGRADRYYVIENAR
jgi:hypothetical protein